ncbi:CHAP domain-containing protein [Novosphingobium sp. PhB165]|uniref:CHAP domain-containing protein n=1 Tax=Novosphingobium sp. PhB165 TaxID=2485105 RepID=UPI001047EB79|nr:CHAP domain-containing protein [Novosphingobium sp. PhB165]
MKGYRRFIILGLALAAAAPASARSAIDDVMAGADGGGSEIKGPDYLECVPYARRLSGIRIFGDAHTWWDQAQGRYATGHRPRVGAVMAIPAYANSHLGHVATVSRIVDSRTILISHANWSPIEGRRGQVEDNVTALDVSPDNDWSEVRIWYAPIHNLGTTHWPVEGFIYNAKPGAVKDLGQSRLESVSGEDAATPVPASPPETEIKPTKKGRRSDPIGAIIAGTYR